MKETRNIGMMEQRNSGAQKRDFIIPIFQYSIILVSGGVDVV
jgi:hypothetical protein